MNVLVILLFIVIITIKMIIIFHVKAWVLNRRFSLTSTPIDYQKRRKFLEFRQVCCLKGPYISMNIE